MGELRDRMEADLRLRGYAEKTRVAYVSCIRAVARHFRRSPATLGEDDIRAYLTYLIDVRRVRPATQVVHAAALRFLYRITLQQPELAARVPRPRRPDTLPTVLSVQELGQVLGAISAPKYRALFLTCYGAGLRIGEACALERTDIDSTRMLLHVRRGKGGHERYVTLSPRLLTALRAYWRQARPRGPYLFPGATPDRPLSRDAAQRALRQVAAQCGLGKRITPPYAPALLRHPSPRSRHGAPHDPASPRPSLDPLHGALHLRLAQSPGPDSASARRTAGALGPARGVGERAALPARPGSPSLRATAARHRRHLPHPRRGVSPAPRALS
jgi:integrase/recombinase XerD